MRTSTFLEFIAQYSNQNVLQKDFVEKFISIKELDRVNIVDEEKPNHFEILIIDRKKSTKPEWEVEVTNTNYRLDVNIQPNGKGTLKILDLDIFNNKLKLKSLEFEVKRNENLNEVFTYSDKQKVFLEDLSFRYPQLEKIKINKLFNLISKCNYSLSLYYENQILEKTLSKTPIATIIKDENQEEIDRRKLFSELKKYQLNSPVSKIVANLKIYEVEKSSENLYKVVYNADFEVEV